MVWLANLVFILIHKIDSEKYFFYTRMAPVWSREARIVFCKCKHVMRNPNLGWTRLAIDHFWVLIHKREDLSRLSQSILNPQFSNLSMIPIPINQKQSIYIYHHTTIPQRMTEWSWVKILQTLHYRGAQDHPDLNTKAKPRYFCSPPSLYQGFRPAQF